MDIFTPEQFRTAVIVVANRRLDWKPRDFMMIMHKYIEHSMKGGEVHDGVFVLYFTLLQRLIGTRSTTVTRGKIMNTLNNIHWI